MTWKKDSELLALACDDLCIRVLDPIQRRVVRVLEGHSNQITDLVLSVFNLFSIFYFLFFIFFLIFWLVGGKDGSVWGGVMLLVLLMISGVYWKWPKVSKCIDGSYCSDMGPAICAAD